MSNDCYVCGRAKEDHVNKKCPSPVSSDCSAASDNRFIDLHALAVSGEMPPEIKSLIGRCEINETTFSSDDMSLALKFGELVWRRLVRMAEHYENVSEHFIDGDNRAGMMRQAAKDMRFVLSDTARDL